MSKITITIEAYGNKSQIQFDDVDINGEPKDISEVLEELYKILVLLDYTPELVAEISAQKGLFCEGCTDTTDDRILYEMELEEKVSRLQIKLSRINAENIFDIIAPGTRPEDAAAITREWLQEALDKL